MSIRIQLPPAWVDYLTHQPESGMGYQRVNVVLDDGTALEDCVAFNAEEVELPEAYAGRRIKEVLIVDPARFGLPPAR